MRDLLELLLTPNTTRMKTWLEQAWLGRYLDRSLSSDETTWFESYVLDKPELLAMIETDTALRDALAGSSALDVREPAAAYGAPRDGLAGAAATVQPTPRSDQPTPVAGVADFVARARRAGRRPTWLPLAASLLVGVGVGGIGVRSLIVSSDAPEFAGNPTRVIYETMRGTASAPRVEHANSTSPYVLIEVAVPPGAEHIVFRMNGAPDQALTPLPDGFVNFLIRRETLARSADTRIEYQLLGKETRLPIDFR